MKINTVTKFPLWLVGALLYGISWPMPWNINLSFLAWFALVFLFISLKNKESFGRFFATVWIFSFITHTICSGWFLDIPTNKFLIIAGAINESLAFPLPFIPFYFIQKRAGFNRSIWVLPFLFVLGEWIYSTLPHNLGFLMAVHSQTANTWLIQFIDLFGSLSVSFWVFSFNVFIFSALEKYQYRFNSPRFQLRLVIIVFVMIGLPLIYAQFRNHQLALEKSDSITITMVHTLFPPNQKTDQQILNNLDRIVEITDSTSYYHHKTGVHTDLYVWHEGAIPSGNTNAIRRFVQSAVNDWHAPLLAGMQYYEPVPGSELWKPLNRVILFSPDPDTTQPMPFYDKINLAPGWESIPYLSFFHKSGIRFPHENKFHRAGESMRLFTVSAGDRLVNIGTPICFEQNVPSIWNRMVLMGADCFVEVSYESWFGQTYFQKQVAYITRLRAIETRHSVARCSNGGLTFFVDAFGRIYSPAPACESVTTDSLTLSNKITFYTRHQNFFPLLCLIVSAGYAVLVLLSKSRNCKRT